MPARHAPLRACRQDFVCLLYERRLPFKRAGPRSSCWNALEATARRGYVAPRKVGDHWTEHRHGRATSTLITLGRTLRTMGITWCILCRSLRLMPLRPRSSLRARAQLPHHVCPAWAVAISGKKKAIFNSSSFDMWKKTSQMRSPRGLRTDTESESESEISSWDISRPFFPLLVDLPEFGVIPRSSAL